MTTTLRHASPLSKIQATLMTFADRPIAREKCGAWDGSPQRFATLRRTRQVVPVS